MTGFVATLFIAGMIFPALSMLTGIGSLLFQWRHKKYSSPVFVPFIGPLLLTCWVLLAHKSLWLIPIVWVADIGTLAFLPMSPRLIADWWRVSSFTRILTLRGNQDIQSAIITLHSSGHYLLKKSWNRALGDTGIVGLGEPGTFSQTDNQYELTSHHGLRRIFRKIDEGTYRVEEDGLENEKLYDYSLNGWLLKS